MINTIKCIIATLNDVEVKGRDNMDKLLGCIMALETVVQMEEKPVEVKEEENGG
jgi:hypothetical protein